MKKQQFLRIFAFFFAFFYLVFDGNALSLTKNNILSPSDTCYEITLKSGRKVFANIIEIKEMWVKYRECGYAITMPEKYIVRSDITDIKLGTEADMDANIESDELIEKNEAKKRKIFTLFGISLLLFLLFVALTMKFDVWFPNILSVALWLAFGAIVFWILVELFKYKKPFAGKDFLTIITIIELTIFIVVSYFVLKGF